MRWEPLDAKLTQLWDDLSMSTREIGALLGTTKNAVIGRAHRLHLPPRPRVVFRKKSETVLQAVVIKAEPKAPRVAKPRKARAHAPAPPPEAVIDLEATTLPPPPPEPPRPPRERFTYSILDLDSTTCKWPKGDRSPFLFCGEQAVEPLPYCAEHCRVSYNPQPSRQSRWLR